MTIRELITRRAQSAPEAPAIEGLSGAPLSYGSLHEFANEVIAKLRSFSIGPCSIVATVLPNGPEAATAFLTLTSGAVVAPLNPALPPEELGAMLRKLRPSALITSAQDMPTMRELAREANAAAVELVPGGGPGRFELRCDRPLEVGADRLLADPETALIVPTSGTTEDPKMVVLSHQNLLDAAHTFASILDLNPADRCVNVMPLFHTHGLTGAVLASIAAGATVACAPGFEAPRLLQWLQRARATWYTATPSMHRAVLLHARHALAGAPGCNLRVVRSSSSPLAAGLRCDLEAFFGTPVIDSYGMTEATPICSTRLPPGQTKPGSVGLRVSLEVSALDGDGVPLPRGVEGELGVRGHGLFSGYWQDPEASARAFRNGWFLTGDTGKLDEEGFVFLTGRVKDEINRSGEKVAPLAVESVLLSHPAVEDAVVFAAKDEATNEAVIAAVVPRVGAALDPQALLAHAEKHLAPHKVPREIWVVPAIPRSPTGKVRRSQMANELAAWSVKRPAPACPAVLDEREQAIRQKVRESWTLCLGHTNFQDDADFFALGGDSVSAAIVAAMAQQAFGVSLSARTLFEARSVSSLAGVIHQACCAPTASTGVAALRVQADSGPRQQANANEHGVSLEQEFFARHHDANPKFCGNTLLLLFRGPLDVGALQQSIEWVHHRHHALRTIFPTEAGRRYARIEPPSAFALPQVDIERVLPARRDAALREALEESVAPPLYIAKGPLTRGVVVRSSPREHHLLFTYSHMNTDRWSISIFLREVLDRYCSLVTGQRSQLTDLPTQYRDYVEHQQRAVSTSVMRADLEKWKQLLGPVPPQASLASGIHPGVESGRCEPRKHIVPVALVRRLRSAANDLKCTLASLLLLAYGLAIQRFRDEGRTMITTVVNSPLRSAAEFVPLIGCFVDMKPALLDLRDDADLAALSRRTMEVCWLLQDTRAPGSMFCDDPQLPPSRWGFNYRGNIPPPAEHPLPGVSARFHTTRTLLSGIALDELGLEVRPVADPRATVLFQDTFELYLGIEDSEDELRCTLWSSQHLAFVNPRVESILHAFSSVLDMLAAGHPD